MIKSVNILVNFIFVTAITLTFLIFIDFISFHDIYKDYVSPFVLRDLSISLMEGLPGWTTTPDEWKLVGVSFFLKLMISLVNIILIVLVRNRLHQDVNRTEKQG